jgi:hypothetical protein
MNGKLLDTNVVIALQKGVIEMVRLAEATENMLIPLSHVNMSLSLLLMINILVMWTG